MHRVVADLVALGEHPAHQPGVARGLLAKLEEGPVDVLATQHPQEAGGVGARPVVEGQGDDLVPTGAVPDEPAVPAGAADRAHRAQPECAVVAGGEAAGAGARSGAATPRDRPPPVAARSQAGLARQQPDHQLAGAGPLDPGRQGGGAEHLPGAVEPGESDAVAAGGGAAEADPLLVMAARAMQRQAEVARLRPREVREAAELPQRHRRSGTNREDQAAAGLLDARMADPSAPRAQCGGRRDHACAGQDQGGNAKDLARMLHRRLTPGGGCRHTRGRHGQAAAKVLAPCATAAPSPGPCFDERDADQIRAGTRALASVRDRPDRDRRALGASPGRHRLQRRRRAPAATGPAATPRRPSTARGCGSGT